LAWNFRKSKFVDEPLYEVIKLYYLLTIKYVVQLTHVIH